MQISFLLSYILYKTLNILHVCLCTPGIGWARGHTTKSKRLSSCGLQKRGVSSYTPSQTHCPCVCVCVCVWGFAVDARILSYFPSGE